MCVPIAQSSFRYFPQPLPLLPLFHYYSRRVNPWRLPSNIICAMFGSVGSLQNQRLSESNQTNSFAIDSHTHTTHLHTQRECATNPQLIIYGFCLLDSYIFQGKLWQDCLCVRACVCVYVLVLVWHSLCLLLWSHQPRQTAIPPLSPSPSFSSFCLKWF